MVTLFHHKKIISRLLILLYLLIGAGMGNALLLCEESVASSHLSYKLDGQCLSECRSEGEASVRRFDSDFAVISAASCLDTPVSFSHVPLPRGEKLQMDTVLLGWAAFDFPTVLNLRAAELIKLTQGAHPPPRQSLRALRTVILLH